MKAKVDENLCSGCELCVETCPDVFEMTDDMVAKVKTDPAPSEQEDCAREAADECPSEAIIIEE